MIPLSQTENFRRPRWGSRYAAFAVATLLLSPLREPPTAGVASPKRGPRKFEASFTKRLQV